MRDIDILEKSLQDHHKSITEPRLAVFQALQHHKSLTMHELVIACQKVDRASIYRTVTVFEQIGIVVRIPNGWKYRLELGETFHEHHHHATCNSCGARIALPEDKILEKRLNEIASNRNFSLLSHQIELYGTCSVCRDMLPS